MTSGEIRSLYVETLARTTYEGKREAWADIEPRAPWAQLSAEERAPWLGQEEQYATALAEAGLLPTGGDYRCVFEPDGTPLGYRERRLVTEWCEEPALCPGCGVTERQCADKASSVPITARHWANRDEVAKQRAVAKCCPDCRHPLRKVSE